MKRAPVSIEAALGAAMLVSVSLARAADPTTADCLAASDASLKLGNQHKLRAQRAQLLVCAAETCPTDIKKECTRRVDQVNAQVPTIIFGAKDAQGNDLSAVKVTMDGEVLTERLEGTALSIDPGEHSFVFETAGRAPVTKKLVIQQAHKDRRETIAFRAPPVAPTPAQGSPPTPVTAAHGSYSAPTSTTLPEPNHGLGSQRIFALAAGGIGIVGIGVGTAFGVTAMSKKSDAQAACADRCATEDGVTKWNDARSAGNLSTIGFIGGGVLIAGAVLLWLTAPSSVSASTQVGLGPGSLLVQGTW